MPRLMLLLLVVLAIGVLMGASTMPASAQTADQPAAAAPAGEYPSVSGLQPFAAEANFMSLPGYLRLLVFREQGVWMSYAEAQRVVKAQSG
jgi:hypothetical protein